MLIFVLLFIVGLFLLIKGGDLFVNSAVGIARRFNLPELLIGATVVSIGTTLPEVMVSATATVNGNGAMSYGNAIGSIICNTALIAAITVTVSPSKVDKHSLRLPVVFFFVAAAFYVFTAYVFGTFSRITGLILLAIFVVYMAVNIIKAKNENFEKTSKIDVSNLRGDKNFILLKDTIFLILGACIIALGSSLVVDNGIELASAIGVPDSVVALTFVALGTSLPELTTAITSLVKGHSALSLGNIVGANLFNLVLVSGLSVILAPFDVPEGQLLFGKSVSLLVDIPLMLVVMAILTIPALMKGRVSKMQGVILLLLYAAFCVFQFAV